MLILVQRTFVMRFENENLIVTLAVRGVGTCEFAIPAGEAIKPAWRSDRVESFSPAMDQTAFRSPARFLLNGTMNPMDLEQFVSQTLVQIVKGVKRAEEELQKEKAGASVNPAVAYPSGEGGTLILR